MPGYPWEKERGWREKEWKRSGGLLSDGGSKGGCHAASKSIDTQWASNTEETDFSVRLLHRSPWYPARFLRRSHRAWMPILWPLRSPRCLCLIWLNLPQYFTTGIHIWLWFEIFLSQILLLNCTCLAKRLWQRASAHYARGCRSPAHLPFLGLPPL